MEESAQFVLQHMIRNVVKVLVDDIPQFDMVKNTITKSVEYKSHPHTVKVTATFTGVAMYTEIRVNDGLVSASEAVKIIAQHMKNLL